MLLRFLLQLDASTIHFCSYRPLRRENGLPQACALVRNDRIGDGAGSPEGGVWIGRILRGRPQVTPTVLFENGRKLRAAEGVGPYYFVSSKTWRFHLIRHPACGRRRMPPSPQGEGFDEDAIAYFCIHMYTKYNYNPNHSPDQIQTQNHPHTHIHPHPHSQKESGAGLLKVLKTRSCPLLLRLAPRSFDSASLRSG